MARKASHSLMTDGRAAANLAKGTWRDVQATFADVVDRGHSAADDAYDAANKASRKAAKRAQSARDDAANLAKSTRRDASKRVNTASKRVNETRREAARRAQDTRDALTGRAQTKRKWGFFAALASAILGAAAGVAGARLLKKAKEQDSTVRSTGSPDTNPIKPVPASPAGTMPTAPEPIAKVTTPSPVRTSPTMTNGTNPSKPAAL